MLQGKDIANEYARGVSIAPVVKTASVNGTAVDFADCGPEVVSTLASTAHLPILETVGTCIVKLQEADDTTSASFADITSATHTTLTKTRQAATSDAVEAKVFATRAKRYVRAVATIAGTSPSFTISVVLEAPKSSY